MVFQWVFEKVFHDCFRGNLMGVSRMFHEWVKGITWLCQRCIVSVSGISWVFYWTRQLNPTTFPQNLILRVFSCDEQLKKWRCHWLCPFVCIHSFWLSIQSIWSKMFYGYYKGVSWVSQGCFKNVSRVFQRSLRVFQGSFKGVPRKFQWCLEGVLRMFRESFTAVSRIFQGRWKNVSKVFQGSFKKTFKVF